MFERKNKLEKKVSVNYDNFDALKVSLASPEVIRSWSRGEVIKSETVNYKSHKPEKDGLFCEKIFGPVKDFECACGKYKKIRYQGTTCEKCGVKVTRSKVRREWMGHIDLAVPVAHIWYVKGVPSKIALLIDIPPKALDSIINYAAYIVLDPGETELEKYQILDKQAYIEYKASVPNSYFAVGIGAETIKKILKELDLKKLAFDINKELKNEKISILKKQRLMKKFEVVNSFLKSGARPEWMVLDVLPVIPPELRPMVELDGGRWATFDINDLYRRVINRNNRLKKLIENKAPDIILENEKRLLQAAVDALIDNGRNGKLVMGGVTTKRAYKSLSELLKGKQGRFRQNLLGKRVDYSARSVIVIGPELKFYQCGLPKDMALKLFENQVIAGLVKEGITTNESQAKKMVDEKERLVWDMLEDIIVGKTVLLNRAPTLHRLGIQAFEPILTEGQAIKLHPLVCTAFNADFDGDQMAVHLPLSLEAQTEARYLMLSTNNILAPKDGLPITTPTQDMILGCYYLTSAKDSDEEKKVKTFMNYDELEMALNSRQVDIRQKVKVRVFKDEKDKIGKIIESTVGKFIFNRGIPQDLGYVDRKKDPYSLEVNFLCGKKQLADIINRCFRVHGNARTAEVLDYIKDKGFHFSTYAAVTIGISDMIVPKEKESIIKKTEKIVNDIEDDYEEGFINDAEKTEEIIKAWAKATEEVTDKLMENLDDENNIKIMADSGARGSTGQIRQIGGMRGLMANAKGETVEIPIKANFREGLSVLEFFISSNGARKGLSDTALRTAESGYLTRRLVDVSHSVIVREEDCDSDEYLTVAEIKEDGMVLETLTERIIGRTAFDNIKIKGKIIVKKNEIISEEKAEEIVKGGVKEVNIKSPLTCKAKTGICATCYGRNLGTGEKTIIGDAVGVIAAQSIGEPGTQLTMRNFHTGGVVAERDITQGLPRVEELFEVRRPKGEGLISTMNGKIINIENGDGGMKIITIEPEKAASLKTKKSALAPGELYERYTTPRNFRHDILVKKGQSVKAGERLTEGPLWPQNIMEFRGATEVIDYLIREIQKTYRLQGVDINDRHIETIASQMLSKYEVTDAGDTALLTGGVYSKNEIEEENAKIVSETKKKAEYKQKLLGITKASLGTESFLSAASFQETTKVLTDAAIKGKRDKLTGLKENVIVGRLIPAGTGIGAYNDIDIDYKKYTDYVEDTMNRGLEETEEITEIKKPAEKFAYK
ncbi:MAG: DNA-directed RNA polymerase subunit beta' [Clostridiales Family XIII bacterium]|jgi:DNA-directed RNA polymerase subunit beta'|nr:DNA-directed RNA polymerase subunit beta' [Clostridiales Family XIII bacterium]